MAMEGEWITDRRITCMTDDGERVIVLRQRNSMPGSAPRHRYVLGNSHDVIMAEDGRFRVLGADIALAPVSTDPAH
jgi:hypothetical protein